MVRRKKHRGPAARRRAPGPGRGAAAAPFTASGPPPFSVTFGCAAPPGGGGGGGRRGREPGERRPMGDGGHTAHGPTRDRCRGHRESRPLTGLEPCSISQSGPPVGRAPSVPSTRWTGVGPRPANPTRACWPRPSARRPDHPNMIAYSARGNRCWFRQSIQTRATRWGG